MTTTFSIKKEVDHQINIQVPSFWKDKITDKVTGILDTDSVYTIFHVEGRFTALNVGVLDNDTAQSIQRAKEITEDEFFSAYNKAYESLRLWPKIQDNYTEQLKRILGTEKY